MSLQIDFAGSVWRRERDSNPREIALKRISSAPRYDHFDTTPFTFPIILVSNSQVNRFCGLHIDLGNSCVKLKREYRQKGLG